MDDVCSLLESRAHQHCACPCPSQVDDVCSLLESRAHQHCACPCPSQVDDVCSLLESSAEGKSKLIKAMALRKKGVVLRDMYRIPESEKALQVWNHTPHLNLILHCLSTYPDRRGAISFVLLAIDACLFPTGRQVYCRGVCAGR